jgi:hypothetical protein
LSELSASNPFLVVVATWRNASLVFLRVPFLALGSFSLYVVLSAYWAHYKPFYISNHVVSQAGYLLLHGVVFAPLALAAMQLVARPDGWGIHIWNTAIIRVGLILVLYGIFGYAVTVYIRTSWGIIYPPRFLESYTPSQITTMVTLYQLHAIVLRIGFFLLSIRLCLLLPESEWSGLKAAVRKAWQDMLGSYLFALAVSCAALLPIVIANAFLSQLYRSLARDDVLPVKFSLSQWEALTVLSAEWTIDYVLIAALAATLYQAIETRTKSTAPSP